MLDVIMLIVIMLIVIMLSVVAPILPIEDFYLSVLWKDLDFRKTPGS
jgi:hypothetical protein